jgi:hypothetical protein
MRSLIHPKVNHNYEEYVTEKNRLEHQLVTDSNKQGNIL